MTPITNHFHAGIVKLIPPLWGKPCVAAMLQSFLNRVTELEDATWDVLDRYTIAGADDTRLAVLGRIVGQPNFGWDTETYRAVIRGKIRANRSRGLVSDLIEVIRLVTGANMTLPIEAYAPATCTVTLTAVVTDAVQAALAYLLPKTRPAGVQLHLYRPMGATVLAWGSSTDGSGTLFGSSTDGSGALLYSVERL